MSGLKKGHSKRIQRGRTIGCHMSHGRPRGSFVQDKGPIGNRILVLGSSMDDTHHVGACEEKNKKKRGGEIRHGAAGWWSRVWTVVRISTSPRRGGNNETRGGEDNENVLLNRLKELWVGSTGFLLCTENGFIGVVRGDCHSGRDCSKYSFHCYFVVSQWTFLPKSGSPQTPSILFLGIEMKQVLKILVSGKELQTRQIFGIITDTSNEKMVAYGCLLSRIMTSLARIKKRIKSQSKRSEQAPSKHHVTIHSSQSLWT